MRKVIIILGKKQKREIVYNTILGIFAAIFELLGISALLPLITVITTPELIYSNDRYRDIAGFFNITSVNQFIILCSIGLIFLYVFKNLFLMYQYKTLLNFTYGYKRELSTRLLNCYMEQPYLFHVEHNVADLQRNVFNDVNLFFTFVLASMKLLIEGLTTIFIVAYLFIVDVVTTLIVIFILIFIFVLIYKPLKKMQSEIGVVARDTNAEVNKWLLQGFAGIKEIKVINKENYFEEKYDEAYLKNNEANKKSEMLMRFPKYIIEAVCISSLLIAICIRIEMGVDVNSFISVLSAFAMAAIRLLPSFNRITEYVGQLLFAKSSIEHIYSDLMELETLKVVEMNSGYVEMEFEDSICIKGLSYKYSGTDEYVLQDVNLNIKKNESVALIGSSGSGKTTIADIILGVLSPVKGEVLVDGVNIVNNMQGWHAIIGYIPQTIYLMDGSIRENVLFGDETKQNDKAVWNALEKAQLREFVESLPQKLNTQIGDRGVKLSGGQRQRIGIARALYRNPQVLVLDEATSALDQETEKAVMEAIEYLNGKITIVIIAHRLSTIKMCDRIYRVDNRKVDEQDREDVLKNE